MHAERKPDVGSGEPQVSFRHPAASPPNILRAHVVPRVGVRGAHYDERCGHLLADDRARCCCAKTSLACCVYGCVHLYDPRLVSCFCDKINASMLLPNALAPPYKDEGMLPGMFTKPPSNQAVEAVASTELMRIVLHYKYLTGPIVIFAFDILIFLVLFSVISRLITSKDPDLAMALSGMIFNLYFTLREVHKLMTLRAQEIAAVEANNETLEKAMAAEARAARDRKKLNTEGKRLKAESAVVGAFDSRRKSFSKVNYPSDSETESDQEVEDIEAEEESEASEEFRYLFAVQTIGKTCDLDNISYLITVHLGFAVAWRKNVFNW